MFCSMCGGEIGDKLNYCNKCGAKLVKDEDGKRPPSILGLLVTSVSFIAIFGFAILVGLVAVLLGNSLPFDMVVIVSFFYLVALSGISFMLLRPISRLASGHVRENAGNTESSGSYQPPQLDQARPAALNEPLRPVASVTENTTRTLDEVLVERK